MTDTGNTQPIAIEKDTDGVIQVRGEVDMATGPLIEAAVADRQSTGPIVIDVGDVTFIDSSGLRSLLAIARDAGAQVVLRRVGPEVARLLDITGTAVLFTVEPIV